MSELDELRKKRLEELKAQFGTQQEESPEQQIQAQLQQLEQSLRPLFTKDALTRFGTVKTAHPEKATQVLLVLSQLANAGKLKKVDDHTLKQMLNQLTPKQRETKIRRV